MSTSKKQLHENQSKMVHKLCYKIKNITFLEGSTKNVPQASLGRILYIAEECCIVEKNEKLGFIKTK